MLVEDAITRAVAERESDPERCSEPFTLGAILFAAKMMRVAHDGLPELAALSRVEGRAKETLTRMGYETYWVARDRPTMWRKCEPSKGERAWNMREKP